MFTRASACVLLLALVASTGCSSIPMTKPTFERTCEKVETAWDEEEERVILIEYGCKLIEPAKERQVWLLIFEIVGALVGVLAFVL